MDPGLSSLAHFAAQFVKELEEGKTQVCSPLSAQAVLALTALGSSGETKAELLQAMALPDDDALRSLFSFVTSSTKSVEGITLMMANKVYVKKGGRIQPNIQKDAEEVFELALEQVDFRDKQAVAFVVNNWVAERTNNMITYMLDPESVDHETRLLLINAIYFQGFWEQPFSKKETKDKPFHVNLTTEIHVPTMILCNMRFNYKYSQILQAQILKMYYKCAQASMVLVVPDAVEGLRGLLNQLASGHNLMAELADMECTLLDVFIPTFKIETEIDLKELLPKIGIKNVFVSGINMLTTNEPQYVSDAIQKAVIEVNEAGSKAAAVTKLSFKRIIKRQRPPPKRIFMADRPFFYLLMARQIPIFLRVYQGREFARPRPTPESVFTGFEEEMAE